MLTSCCLTAPLPEQMDFALDASRWNMSYVIFNDQVIKPRFECKTIYEMTSELAKRLGVEQQFTEGRISGRKWMRHLYAQLGSDS